MCDFMCHSVCIRKRERGGVCDVCHGMYMTVCVCVCVCVRERERERQTHTHTHIDVIVLRLFMSVVLTANVDFVMSLSTI